MKKEIEIKFKIEKRDQIEKKLLKLGGIPKKFYKQKTYCFFSENSREKGIFPRIRKEQGVAVLTVKVKSKKKTNYFERKEYSVKLDNIKEGISVLKALGFTKIGEFTKERQEWRFSKVEIMLDKLYFGTFLEIEGSKKNIENMVKLLGFRNKERIIKSYLRIEDDYKQKNHN